MIRISQLKLPITHTESELKKKIAKTLRCGEKSFSYEIIRQSLDARHKEDKKFVYTIEVSIENEKKILQKVHNNNIMSTIKKEYVFPKAGNRELSHRPVIVGSGPAGIFCAWYLARAGYRPLVLERGEEAKRCAGSGIQRPVWRRRSRNFFGRKIKYPGKGLLRAEQRGSETFCRSGRGPGNPVSA